MEKALSFRQFFVLGVFLLTLLVSQRAYAQMDLALPQSWRWQAATEVNTEQETRPLMLSATSSSNKEKSEFDNFVKDHAGRVLRSVFGGEADIYTGTPSFLSKDINSAMGTPSARLVGVSETIGKVQVGGGYSWGEKNPAYMSKRDGVVFGLGTRGETWNAQASYIMGGKKLMGIKLGREKYDSIALGVSFDAQPDEYGKMPYWHGMTGALQWRNHDRAKKDNDIMVTIGKHWSF